MCIITANSENVSALLAAVENEIRILTILENQIVGSYARTEISCKRL